MPLPDLPEPNHFTLEQISQRWDCGEEILIQYCRSNMLEIGVILNDTRAYLRGNTLNVDTDKQEKKYSILDGFYALSIGDVEGTAYFGETPSDEYSCRVREVYLSNDHPESYYYEGEKRFIDNIYKLERTHIFLSTQLVITICERDRFETDHSMQISESTINNKSVDKKNTSATKTLDTRERTTWGRIVKALCLELNIPLDNAYTAASEIQRIAIRNKVHIATKDETIAKRIKEIKEIN